MRQAVRKTCASQSVCICSLSISLSVRQVRYQTYLLPHELQGCLSHRQFMVDTHGIHWPSCSRPVSQWQVRTHLLPHKLQGCFAHKQSTPNLRPTSLPHLTYLLSHKLQGCLAHRWSIPMVTIGPIVPGPAVHAQRALWRVAPPAS